MHAPRRVDAVAFSLGCAYADGVPVMIMSFLKLAGLAAGLQIGLRLHWFQQPRPFPRVLAALLEQPARLRYLDPEPLLDLCGVTPDMTVLEVGCGTGVVTAALARKMTAGGQVIALDIQESLLDRARARVEATGCADKVTFHWAEPETAPLAMHTADLILLGSVLGEIPELHSCLTRLFAVAKPQSRVVVYEEALHPGFVSAGMARMHLHAAGFRQGGLIRKSTHYVGVYYKDEVVFDPDLKPGTSNLGT